MQTNVITTPQYQFHSVLVKALCYKPEGRGFETQWGGWFFFSIYLILPTVLGPGVYSASNRNEYQKQKNIFWGQVVNRISHKYTVCRLNAAQLVVCQGRWPHTRSRRRANLTISLKTNLFSGTDTKLWARCKYNRLNGMLSAWALSLSQ
jgi:hypothetical protein